MKPVTVLLAAYVIIQAFRQALFHANLQYLARHGHKLPAGFEDVVNAPALARVQDYTLSRGRVEAVSAFAAIAVTIFFLFGGLLDRYNTWVLALALPPLFSGISFFLLLLAADTVLRIPVELYQTFVVEERFGFNRQTLRLWATDQVKAFLVSVVLTTMLLAAVFWLINRLPGSWWLAVWLFLLLFSVFMIYLAPYVIEPMFNTFTPITDPELEKKVRTVLARAGLEVSRLFAMDASKRSSHSNAYFTGIGHVKRIILFDTLLANHDQDEIIAILAHEAGHWKKRHLLQMLLVSQGVSLLGLYGAFLLINSNLPARFFGISQPTLWANLLLAGFIGSLVLFPLKPLASLLSRRHEREADRFAVALTGDAGPLARALVRLGLDNLANLHPHPWFAAWHYSHPPLAKRVAGLLAEAAPTSRDDNPESGMRT